MASLNSVECSSLLLFSKTFNDLVKEKGIKIKIFGSRKNLPNKILEIFQNIVVAELLPHWAILTSAPKAYHKINPPISFENEMAW